MAAQESNLPGMIRISLPCRNRCKNILPLIIIFQLLVILYMNPQPEHFLWKIKRDTDNSTRMENYKQNHSAVLDSRDTLIVTRKVAARNLPYQEKYSDSYLAFPRKDFPSSVSDWTPSPDSYKYWQPIGTNDSWIYSAFFSHELKQLTSPMIIGFGLARTPVPKNIYCHFKGAHNQLIIISGKIKHLREDHRTHVVPVVYECSIGQNFYPDAISVTFEGKQELTNKVKIEYPGVQKRQFTVCYSALHSAFNFTAELVQSIELNMILGAEHFYVYNFSISPEVDQILRHYMAKGVLTVQQWPLPTIESWYLGQMVAINDCMYRNRNVSEFVVLIDTDEFIIPVNRYTWKKLIQDLMSNPNLTTKEPDTNYEMVENAKPGRRLLSIPEGNDRQGPYKESEKIPTSIVLSPRPSNESKDNQTSTQNKPEVSIAKTKQGDNILPANFTNPSITSTAGNLPTNSATTFNSSPNRANPANVTRMHHSSNQLLTETANRTVPKLIGAFMFKNTFFNQDAENDQWAEVKANFSISDKEEFFIKHCSVQALEAYKRTAIYPDKARSKTIVRPELVYIVGIHFVHDHMPNAETLYVKPNVAYLHHYRPFIAQRSTILDTSTFKYRRDLLTRLENTFGFFPNLFACKPGTTSQTDQ